MAMYCFVTGPGGKGYEEAFANMLFCFEDYL